MQLLDEADVFVLPSYAEGFPNALLEAMARGLPAICTDVGGVSDSLHHEINGFLIPPRNVDALVEAMSCYLRDTSLVERQSSETIKIVAKNHDRVANCKLLFSALSTP
jgi:glycosyltransferase involved in cell wall biosynthesis